MTKEHFLISCDWGTSTFRLRLLRGAPEQPVPSLAAERLDHRRGISSFTPNDTAAFAAMLASEIEPLLCAGGVPPSAAPIWLSGMITSSLGWKQLPYARLPFKLDGSTAILGTDTLKTPCGTHQLFFVSGIRADDDVIRGEECELMGLFAHPDSAPYGNSAVVVIPGTHSKCVDVRDDSVIGFRTFLTGELFDVLGSHSILRHSVREGEFCREAFTEGVLRAAGQGLLGSLFSIRARALLEGVDPSRNRSYLSGLLIGDELSAVKNRSEASVPILLCGASALTGLYALACDALGLQRHLRLPDAGVAAFAASIGHWRLHCERQHQWF